MKLLKQPITQYKIQSEELTADIAEIIKNVIDNGDVAVKKYNSLFDGNERELFRVSKEEIEVAYNCVDKAIVEDIRLAAKNIAEFARLQKSSSEDFVEKEIYPGVILGHRRIPVDACCCYVPGGNYPLFSTALMLAIPAKIAGVHRVAACSPAVKGTGKINPLTLVAMDIAGVDEIYAIGGAQAIAAFAYGTDQIKPVDIIVGPGNMYVTEAKRQCYGQVGIDFVAGPSEVIIIADESANPELIAADLLAQAEHDINARGILMTTSEELGIAVINEVENQLKVLETSDMAQKSWQDNGEVILCDTLEQAAGLSNEYAPEHLEIMVDGNKEQALISLLSNYGSLFLGQMSAEVFGDYISGTNHTLPTSRASRYTGGVWVGTFLKTCTHQKLTSAAVESLGPVACRLAQAEGLYAHSNAAAVRVK